MSYYTISRAIATRNVGGFGCNKKCPARMQDEARTFVSGLFESIIVERRHFCVSKKCDH
ncbi:hypothetical protein SELSPUOL_01566 [Selenomonas sputigena ATCC 35185]|uniref:Uncharacterized protein n=1 Tax=Selenomonas sputigena (strain ATCC 35185 / DSM 20758 / CCUG 44933 / VPI D19B-28) TaxID=546271 RepID=C9LVS2_SELS3|nr:hypothetical protein SELSPUOL_01566 [Selenomonas sputigena ATCC 35185]